MGQIEQLLDRLKDMKFPITTDPWQIKEALGEKIWICTAIILVEEKNSPKRENEELKNIAEDIRWSIDPETLIQVIEDFFDCNPIASILKRLAGLMKKISSEIGFKKQSSSSPEAISQSEIKSSGDIPPESANPISVINPGT